ncbi:hypothetical protein WJX82_005185 [Trebouxia sp. C0006]
MYGKPLQLSRAPHWFAVKRDRAKLSGQAANPSDLRTFSFIQLQDVIRQKKIILGSADTWSVLTLVVYFQGICSQHGTCLL